MIIYNVTINVDDAIVDNWVEYMKQEHLPDVMKTGCFLDFTFSKILTRHEDETGQTFSVQYKSESMQQYNEYIDTHADRLREEVVNKYKGQFYTFRTLLEVID